METKEQKNGAFVELLYNAVRQMANENIYDVLRLMDALRITLARHIGESESPLVQTWSSWSKEDCFEGVDEKLILIMEPVLEKVDELPKDVKFLHYIDNLIRFIVFRKEASLNACVEEVERMSIVAMVMLTIITTSFVEMARMLAPSNHPFIKMYQRRGTYMTEGFRELMEENGVLRALMNAAHDQVTDEAFLGGCLAVMSDQELVSGVDTAARNLQGVKLKNIPE